MGIPPPPLLRADRIESAEAEWLLGYQVARIVPEIINSDGDIRSGDMFQRRLLSSNQAFWTGKAGKSLLKKSEASGALRALVRQLQQHLGDPSLIGHWGAWVELVHDEQPGLLLGVKRPNLGRLLSRGQTP